MSVLDIINNIVKLSFISFFIYCIYIKIIDFHPKVKHTGIILLFDLITAILYSYLKNIFGAIIIYTITYFIYSILLAYITKSKIKNSIITVLISFTITYGIYLFSLIVSMFFIKLFFDLQNQKNIFILILALLIENMILLFFTHLKRLKNGLGFIKNNDKIDSVLLYCILFFSTVLSICGLIQGSKNIILNLSLEIISIIATISAVIWIRTRITKQYRDNMQLRTIDLQEAELKEKDNLIKELKEENLKLSSTIHKYNNRFEALQNAVLRKLNNEETSEELSIMLEDLNEMSNAFSNEVTEATWRKVKLSKTNIYEVDNILEYMANMAVENNIRFDLKINDSIINLIDKVIPKDDFCTLIGDHIKDAIIAINSSNNKNKQILCVLGIVNGFYEFSIFDTGVEFSVDTLLKLGEERITTHKDTGGSGIGFMTTFENLNKCNGSVCIEEYQNDSYYTKQIIFRFDGLKEYRIHSYRNNEIKLLDKKQRIVFY